MRQGLLLSVWANPTLVGFLVSLGSPPLLYPTTNNAAIANPATSTAVLKFIRFLPWFSRFYVNFFRGYSWTTFLLNRANQR